MNKTRIDTATAREALARIIASANGGALPANLDLHVSPEDTQSAAVVVSADGRDRLIVTINADGPPIVTVGVATWWTMLLHHRFRFARTPGGALILLGRHGGRKMHFSFEEDRLWCEAGSPMLSDVQDREAITAFDAEFAARIGGTL